MNCYKQSNGGRRQKSLWLCGAYCCKSKVGFLSTVSQLKLFSCIIALYYPAISSKILSPRSFYSVDMVLPQMKNVYILSCPKLHPSVSVVLCHGAKLLFHLDIFIEEAISILDFLKFLTKETESIIVLTGIFGVQWYYLHPCRM